MRIGILRHGEPGYAENELLRIGQERGHQIEIIDPYTAELSISTRPELEVLISRAEIGSYADSDAYFRFLDFYEAWGIPIINGKQATLNAQDKFRTHVLAAMAGLDTPKTVICYGAQNVRELCAEEKRNFPYIIKRPYSGRGKDVFFVQCENDFERIVSACSENEPLIIQEYIPLEKNEEGNFRDMRLLVCRDATTEHPEFLGGFYRNSRNGNFSTNLSTGGSITHIEVMPDGVLYMAERSLEAITADVAGVDIALSKDGVLYLIEINISFDSRKEIGEAIGVPIEKKILDLAESRVRRKYADTFASSSRLTGGVPTNINGSLSPPLPQQYHSHLSPAT